MIDAIPTLAGVTVKATPVSAKTAVSASEEPLATKMPTGASNSVERSANRGGQEQASPAELKQAVESINGFLQNQKRALEFSVDDETGHVVITVMDVERKEVIRQIPSELALKLMAQAREGGGLRGTGLSEKA